MFSNCIIIMFIGRFPGFFFNTLRFKENFYVKNSLLWHTSNANVMKGKVKICNVQLYVWFIDFSLNLAENSAYISIVCSTVCCLPQKNNFVFGYCVWVCIEDPRSAYPTCKFKINILEKMEMIHAIYHQTSAVLRSDSVKPSHIYSCLQFVFVAYTSARGAHYVQLVSGWWRVDTTDFYISF